MPDARRHKPIGTPPTELAGKLARGVFHLSDFSDASTVAFHHALKLALLAKAPLSMLHASPEPHGKQHAFPSVHETLVRWRVLPRDSTKEAVNTLGIDVRKLVQKDPDPVHSVLRYLRRHPADLVVMGLHRKAQPRHRIDRSMIEPITRGSGRMILCIPEEAAGFVAAGDGGISLKTVLIPVARTPWPQASVNAAARIVGDLQRKNTRFILLHVGSDGNGFLSSLTLRKEAGSDWNHLTATGSVVDSILGTAAECQADLIVMATDGKQGFVDRLWGTTTEQVLRRAPCPLLVVPVESERA